MTQTKTSEANNLPIKDIKTAFEQIASGKYKLYKESYSISNIKTSEHCPICDSENIGQQIDTFDKNKRL